MYLGYQNGKIKFYTEQPLEKEFYNLDDVVETQDEYVLNGEEYVLKDEAWEEKQKQAERERIGNLKLTGADVERGIYQAKGMDFDDILAFVIANPPQGLDVKALKIELKANHFYRGNPYVDAVGALLGFTSEQLDKFFETNDYTCLLPDPIEETEEPVVEPVEGEDVTHNDPKEEIIEEPVVDNSEEVVEENPVIAEAEGDEV